MEKEEFKVENAEDVENSQSNAEHTKLFGNLANFFVKKTVVEVEDEKQDCMYSQMEKIDQMFIPQSEINKKKKNTQEEDEFIGVP